MARIDLVSLEFSGLVVRLVDVICGEGLLGFLEPTTEVDAAVVILLSSCCRISEESSPAIDGDIFASLVAPLARLSVGIFSFVVGFVVVAIGFEIVVIDLDFG